MHGVCTQIPWPRPCAHWLVPDLRACHRPSSGDTRAPCAVACMHCPPGTAPPFPSTPLQALAMFLHLLKTCDKEQTLVSLTGNWLLRAFPWGRWGTRVGGVEHSWHGQGSSHSLPQGGPHNPAATSLTLFPRGSEDRASDQTLWLSQIILLGMRWGGPVALVCVGMWGRPWPTADWEPPGQGKEGAGLRA